MEMTRPGPNRAARQMSFPYTRGCACQRSAVPSEAAHVPGSTARPQVDGGSNSKLTAASQPSCLVVGGRPLWISLIDPKVDEVVDRQLRGYYLRPERPSIRSLIDPIHTSCDELGLPKPSWRAIKRRIRRLDCQSPPPPPATSQQPAEAALPPAATPAHQLAEPTTS
jgi:hypothetical protein